MANENPSLCIPRLMPTDDFPIITYASIKYIIDKAELGRIKKIDMIERTGEAGINYLRVFIHFNYWYDTEKANKAKKRILDGKTIKIARRDNLLGFWKLSINNWSKGNLA